MAHFKDFFRLFPVGVILFYFFTFFFWLHWVFIAARRLSLVAGDTLHCGVRVSHCGGFSCCGARAVGARASAVVARGHSRAQAQ